MGKEAEAAAGAPAREAGAAVEGAGATPATPPPEAPPTAAAGVPSPPPAPPVPPVAPPVAPGAAAGAAAEAAPVSAEELGGIARKAISGTIGEGEAKAALAAQAAPNAKIAAAADALGVKGDLQADALSTNVPFKQLMQVIKSIPGSVTRAAEQVGLGRVMDRAAKAIDDFGGTGDLASLSDEVKKNLWNGYNGLKGKADALYTQIRDAIPATTSVSADNVLNVIKQRALELGGVENLSPMEKEILRKLSPKQGAAQTDNIIKNVESQVAQGAQPSKEDMKAYLRAKFGGQVQAEAAAPKLPTYALLDDVRRDVGEGMNNKGVFKDASDRLKGMLYNALSKDQEAVAAAHGMGDVFNAARAHVVGYSAIKDNLINLFGKQVDGTIVNALRNATEVLSKGDASKLVNMMKSIPDELKQKVAASSLAAAFEKGSRSGEMNFAGFSTWYEGLLKNKPAYHAIMSNLPGEARKTISNLYRVSKGISTSTKEFIGTGRLSEGVKVIKDRLEKPSNLMERLYEVAHHAIKAGAAEAATSAVGAQGFGICAHIV
jgi:hypothetical protein